MKTKKTQSMSTLVVLTPKQMTNIVGGDEVGFPTDKDFIKK